MGFSISWIAVRGKSKQDILTATGLCDSGEPDEVCERPVCGAELPDGWYVLFMNDVCHPFIAPKFMEDLSRGCELIGCQVEEHAMMSIASCYRDGTRIWHISHDAQVDLYDVEASGELPNEFAAAKAEFKAQQDSEGGRNAGVDYIFEIPLVTAQQLCGYKHDQWKFDWGQPIFTALQQAETRSDPPRRTFIQRLFGS